MSGIDVTGLKTASQTVEKIAPEVTEALAQAEASISKDLSSAEAVVMAALSNAVTALADAVTQVIAAADRLDGGSITITFNFPMKATK